MKTRLGIAALALASLALLLTATACGGSNPFGVKSELVAEADHPVALAFAPDGRLFFAEQFTGNIRVVTPDGELLEEPFAQEQVANYLEWGITGLTLDPDFETNHAVYVFLTQLVDPEPLIGRPLVVRYAEQDNRRTTDRDVLVGDLPDTTPERHGFNTNGKIRFGPDGFLYISLGDYDTPDLVQDLSTPVGKMLRVSKEDGSAAPGNPLVNRSGADPRIFAYGFREPFDFAFHPQTNRIYGSDNTPVDCEELNIIEAGANYGWPDVGQFPYPDCLAGEQTKAIHFFAREAMKPEDFLSFVAVSSLAFVSGDKYPLLGDSLLVCEFETKVMRRLVLSGTNQDEVTADDLVLEDCQMDIAVSPDGTVYYSNDKEIRRLVPQ